MCRSRRELSNEYLLAQFGFDTAESEPSKVWPMLNNSSLFFVRLKGTRGEPASPRGGDSPGCCREVAGVLWAILYYREWRVSEGSRRQANCAEYVEQRIREMPFESECPGYYNSLRTSEILQVNVRLTAFFNLYKMCTLLDHRDLKILAKNRFEKSAIFVKIQQEFCKYRKMSENVT